MHAQEVATLMIHAIGALAAAARQCAVQQLQCCAVDETLLAALDAAMANSEALWRRRAVELLIAFTLDPRDISSRACTAARDRSWIVREAAAKVLARQPELSPSAQQELAQLALGDSAVLVRSAAEKAPVEWLLPFYAAALADSRHKLRCRALDYLGHSGELAVPHLPAIIRCLGDSHRKVRVCAANAVAKLAEYSAAALPVVVQHICEQDIAVAERMGSAFTAIIEALPPASRSKLAGLSRKLISEPASLKAWLKREGTDANIVAATDAVKERRDAWRARVGKQLDMEGDRKELVWLVAHQIGLILAPAVAAVR
jgi:hypothetical protein